MGPGHLGIGFAAKSIAPKAPLWMLLAGSEALDLLCLGFVSIGMEKLGEIQMDFSQGLQYASQGFVPWSHGLFMSLVWSILFGAFGYFKYRDGRTSVVIGLVVFSHWVLDFLVHPPDLPLLFKNSPLMGLGLWTSGPGFIASLVLELVLLAGGIVVYRFVHKQKPKTRGTGETELPPAP